MKNDTVQIGKYGHPKPNPKPTLNLGTLNPTPNFNPIWVIGHQNGFVDFLQTRFNQEST
jgi:hypothetical protein